MSRKPWDLAFLAEPAEVAALRCAMRLQLGMWGLHGISDQAQLCVSELVTNVIRHAGAGTPARLAVSMSGTDLRIEVHDPDTRALPTLLDVNAESEGGRGMALVDAVADRWGVLLRPDQKITWCELSTGLTAPDGHVEDPGVLRAEALLSLYAAGMRPRCAEDSGRLAAAVAEEVATAAITDFLHWLRAHGCDVDDALDRAQTRFEAEAEAA
ncbi:ATP-binding protein [Streptomyces sp. GXMU-J15]|uniref:ATP-binding protein n=1 Tax=Streptomyces fuscus TaxID=3048495 RepID=A0ABT7J7D6_9ACTN|nr:MULTISPECIES: ATP-binding protein [Streptomyces]MDL2079667.1 ATP-binding protein [Streptomyces fuscus]SBT91192.1 Anti-sigma regulatory factor (Ser/Thr protein kinase) [Streptomyces sp. DI166]